jgi:hypothetical protein
MISKKTLTMALVCALGVSAGCVSDDSGVTPLPPPPAPPAPATQVLNVNAVLGDADGYALGNVYFDYYLQLQTTASGTPLAFAVLDAQTDADGRWARTVYDPVFYQNNGIACALECVEWDAYGCRVLAEDCWNDVDAFAPDLNTVVDSEAAVGLFYEDIYATQYAVYYSADEINGIGIDSYTQDDFFPTDLVAYLTGGSSKAKQKPAATSKLAKAPKQLARPTVISHKDLASKLSSKQKSALGQYRKFSKIPEKSFKTPSKDLGIVATQ